MHVVKVVFRGGQTLSIVTVRVLGKCSSARIHDASESTYVPKMFAQNQSRILPHFR